MSDKKDVQIVMIHGAPVTTKLQSDGQTVYLCPWHGCGFETSFPCDSDDMECRLDAYVKMHDHIKSHTSTVPST